MRLSLSNEEEKRVSACVSLVDLQMPEHGNIQKRFQYLMNISYSVSSAVYKPAHPTFRITLVSQKWQKTRRL